MRGLYFSWNGVVLRVTLKPADADLVEAYDPDRATWFELVGTTVTSLIVSRAQALKDDASVAASLSRARSPSEVFALQTPDD